MNSAIALREAFEPQGYKMKYDSLTNWQFPMLPSTTVNILKIKYIFKLWDEKTMYIDFVPVGQLRKKM